MPRLARRLAVLVLVVLGAGLAGCGGQASTPAPAGRSTATGPAASSSLAGIPQHGLTLGRPSAKVLVVEFIDVQCPYCREFEEGVVPTLLRDYIRTGKIRFEQRTMSFLGPDSVRGARFLAAAGMQNHQFDAAALMFRDQGQENSGYLDDAFLRRIGAGIPGFDTARALSDMAGVGAQATLGAVNSMAQRYGVNATPTVLVGTGITSLEKVSSPSVSEPDAYVAAIDAALRGHAAQPPLPPAPGAPRPQPPAASPPSTELKA